MFYTLKIFAGTENNNNNDETVVASSENETKVSYKGEKKEETISVQVLVKLIDRKKNFIFFI